MTTTTPANMTDAAEAATPPEPTTTAPLPLGAALCSPSDAAVQYADYILNHYSRHSHNDKLCLARDLVESHGWTPNNDIVNMLRLYGWKADESLQMFLHRMKANASGQAREE